MGRAYWSFVGALVFTTFSAAQIWEVTLSLRRGTAARAELVLGAVSVLVLLTSLAALGRILFVVSSRKIAREALREEGK